MPSLATRPETIRIAPDLEISRIITGLWQVADMERNGGTLDAVTAAAALADYARAGFSTFDMADHYGSAELITGGCLRLLEAERHRPPVVMSKWVPEPGTMTPEVVRTAVSERLDRLGTPAIDVLQLHWWQYENPGYLDAMAELEALRRERLIGHLGVTNFDTAHLRVLVKSGFRIATNQVCFSLLDRRAAGEMSAFCRENGVKLLAFGTLGGGFLSQRWLGAPEPSEGEITDWSKGKF